LLEDIRRNSWKQLSNAEKKDLLVALIYMKDDFAFLKELILEAVDQWEKDEFPTLQQIFDFSEIVPRFPDGVLSLNIILRDKRERSRNEEGIDQSSIDRTIERTTIFIDRLDRALQDKL
ncbi:MAG: hypothetical protein ACFFD4_38395, partial [Candidatus Odinarchaeota archaeon]